jgi:spectinomycin phosphotransferase
MLTKPDLKDEKIIACLHDNYGLDVAEISLLPLGADFNTAVYRVTTTDKIDYFLKLRSGDFCETSVMGLPYCNQNRRMLDKFRCLQGGSVSVY